MEVICDSDDQEAQIYPLWILKEVECMSDMYNNSEVTHNAVMSTIVNASVLSNAPEYTEKAYYDVINSNSKRRFKEITFQLRTQQALECGKGHIITLQDESDAPYYQAVISQEKGGQNFYFRRPRDPAKRINKTDKPNYRVTSTWRDGMYHFMVSIGSSPGTNYTAKVYIKLIGPHGYLPAISWPLLPYSGVMSLMYLILGTVWICLWVKTSLHTEKMHIFIGAVAVSGAMTNTMMFVNTESVNNSGSGVPGLDWLSRVSASLQSCLTSALLMVVSTGYGITRPELSRCLVITMAVLTGISVVARESIVIVQDENLQIKYDYPIVDMLVSGFYAFIMLFIAAFIMISSIMTFQHLRLRKHTQNVVLFCIFMITCIIGFVAELVMVTTTYGWFTSCRKNWQWEWLFANFGSVETLVLLIVLMWLWRPIDRSTSYAFYPLQTDEVQDDEESCDEFVASDRSMPNMAAINEKTPLEKSGYNRSCSFF